MMASSQDRAIALKDSYVDTLLKGGVTAPLQGMPETDMGDTASIHTDVRTGRTLAINDGIPDHYLHDYRTGRSAVNENGGRSTAYPVQGGFMWKLKNSGGQNKLTHEYNEYNTYGNPQDAMGRRMMLDARDQNIRDANRGGYPFEPTHQINMDSVRKGKFIKRPGQ